MNKNDRILVLGSRGLVGSAVVSELRREGYNNLFTPVREELELLFQDRVLSYFERVQPDYVFMCAAKVGGIYANNTYRADFIFENLMVQQNVFNAALKLRTQNLLFLGSSCIYPKNCPQPIKEEYLLTSELEPTNEPYSIAKIAGLKVCESVKRQYGLNWTSVMPTNLYGINDNFHLENSHVLPGLIARMYDAKIKNSNVFEVWGTGTPRREFLYVHDMARACLYVMKNNSNYDLLNIGSGKDVTISELVEKIAKYMNFTGKLIYDTSKPNGTMKKCLDISKITSLGWKPEIDLDKGLQIVIKSYTDRMK
jgi:GDP-L-fucose synthase